MLFYFSFGLEQSEIKEKYMEQGFQQISFFLSMWL